MNGSLLVVVSHHGLSFPQVRFDNFLHNSIIDAHYKSQKIECSNWKCFRCWFFHPLRHAQHNLLHYILYYCLLTVPHFILFFFFIWTPPQLPVSIGRRGESWRTHYIAGAGCICTETKREKRAPAFWRAFIMFQNEKETSLFQCRHGVRNFKVHGIDLFRLTLSNVQTV